jgi:ribosomal protein S6--L-glutamate ligase
MSKLLVIGPRQYGISTQMLMDEAKNVFSTVNYIPVNEIQLSLKKTPEITYDGKDITKCDYCLPRIDSKRAPHGYHVIRFMDMLNIKKPYNAESVLIAHNKFMSLEVLNKAGVPIPATYMVSSLAAAKKLLKKMKYPIILKLVGGFGGVGVMVFEDYETASSAIETMNSLKQQILIEEFIPNPGEDYRAIVVGGEMVAAMKRVSKKGEFRANIFMGGKGKYIKLKDDMTDIALEAAAAVNSDIIAIDMIEGKDGPKVIEVNLNPGLKGIKKATNIDVSKKIISFIKSEVK